MKKYLSLPIALVMTLGLLASCDLFKPAHTFVIKNRTNSTINKVVIRLPSGQQFDLFEDFYSSAIASGADHRDSIFTDEATFDIAVYTLGVFPEARTFTKLNLPIDTPEITFTEEDYSGVMNFDTGVFTPK